MQKRFAPAGRVLAVLLGCLGVVGMAAGEVPREKSLTRIAFGSCNREDREQPLWKSIVANRPDLWIWLGDIVYANTQDMHRMRQKYEVQKGHPGYGLLLETCPVIGTWDDHDYGKNNGGREYSKKAQSQQILLDFLDEEEDSPRRRQQGVFASYTYGPEGQQVKVILLDTRYHRGEPGDKGDVLGGEQWAWLEGELRHSKASVHLIGSSIQVLPEEHPYEKWANFPRARQRLFGLIGDSGAPGVIFLSGDRHFGEISRLEHAALSYPLYEITSSGLTHSYNGLKREPNRYRLGNFFNQLNFAIITLNWQVRQVGLEIRDRKNKIRQAQIIRLRNS